MLEKTISPLSSRKVALLAITLLSTVFVLKNTFDERYLLETWTALLTISAFWLAVPYLALLTGLLAKSRAQFWGSMVYALLLMALFAVYAMNGSTADRVEGAQHMHLILVPVFLLFVTFMFIVYLSVRAAVLGLAAGRMRADVKEEETQAR